MGDQIPPCMEEQQLLCKCGNNFFCGSTSICKNNTCTDPVATQDSGKREDFGVALMLLASITFMMSTFYIVNSNDEDLKQAAWNCISATISIFSAVLLFQSVNGAVSQYVLKEDAEKCTAFKCIIDAIHFLIWYLVL